MRGYRVQGPVAAVCLLLCLALSAPPGLAAFGLRSLGGNVFEAGIQAERFVFSSITGRQRNNQWCWAASTQTVLNYYGIGVQQEEIVSRLFGGLPDMPANNTQILAVLDTAAVTLDGSLVRITAEEIAWTDSDIILELANRRPLIVGLNLTGSGHAYVLTHVRYVIQANNEPLITHVTLWDPWPDSPALQVKMRGEIWGKVPFVARVGVIPMTLPLTGVPTKRGKDSPFRILGRKESPVVRLPGASFDGVVLEGKRLVRGTVVALDDRTSRSYESYDDVDEHMRTLLEALRPGPAESPAEDEWQGVEETCG